MKSQPQNPEFRINPENFHPCYQSVELFFVLLVHQLYCQNDEKSSGLCFLNLSCSR